MIFGLIRIKNWINLHDKPIVEWYQVSEQFVTAISLFVATGNYDEAIEEELRIALENFPLWSHLSIDDSLTIEQRESIASVFVKNCGIPLVPMLDLGQTCY